MDENAYVGFRWAFKEYLDVHKETCGYGTKELMCVMKLGGSSVASADRMTEVADLILSFLEERPVIVLSAMGKTTNKLLLAGEKSVSCSVSNVSDLEELTFIKDLHLRTAVELGIERLVVSKHLFELEQILNGIAMMKEMTPRTKDYLVSFGECMSTRIFSAYLNKIGVKARQVLHPLSMRPAREGDIPVQVENSYNPKASGTLITRTRDMSEVSCITVFGNKKLALTNDEHYQINTNCILSDLSGI